MSGGPIETQAISRWRPAVVDTYANLPTSGLFNNEIGYATDRDVVYYWDGAAWQPMTNYSGSGLYSAIPAAANLPNGSLFFATDRVVVYQVQAGAWAAITIYSGSGVAGDIPAFGDRPAGSLYFATDTSILYQNSGAAWTPLTAVSKQVVSGTYTGDNTNNRQITVGFKCKLVIIGGDWIAGQTGWATLVGTRYARIAASAAAATINAGMTLHASDGFIVGMASGTNYDFNVNTVVNSYVAFED